jgi:hypothetical protein
MKIVSHLNRCQWFKSECLAEERLTRPFHHPRPSASLCGLHVQTELSVCGEQRASR